MNSRKTIRIVDITGTEYCISSDDGDKVYDVVSEALKEGKRMNISFSGVEDLNSAFLNAAFGRLYNGDFTEEQLSSSLLPVDADPTDLVLLKRVVERAKEFFRDPVTYEAAVVETLGNNDE